MSLRHSLVKSHPVGLDVMALFFLVYSYIYGKPRSFLWQKSVHL